MPLALQPTGRPWAGPALLGACLTAQAQVIVTPRCLALLPGQTCSFKARLANPVPAELARAQGWPQPDGPWRWSLPEQDAGVLQEDTGSYTAPDVPEARSIRVRATWRSAPETFGEATVTVLPAGPFRPLSARDFS